MKKKKVGNIYEVRLEDGELIHTYSTLPPARLFSCNQSKDRGRIVIHEVDVDTNVSTEIASYLNGEVYA